MQATRPLVNFTVGCFKNSPSRHINPAVNDLGWHLQADGVGRVIGVAKVIVGLSLDDKGHPLFLKMQVVNDLKKETIAQFAHSNVQTGSTISSDVYRSYNHLKEEGFKLESKVFNPKEDEEQLKWLHTILSNAKAFVAGTFHGLDQKHLQRYLDEFCYRFNRRFFASELFNRILNSCIT